MATSTAFTPRSRTLFASASTTPTSVTFSPAESGDCLRIHNRATDPAHVRWGVGAQSADGTDFDVAGLSVEVIGIPSSVDTVSVVLASGAGTVSFTKGEGL